MTYRRSLANLFAIVLLIALVTACGGRATVLPSPVLAPTITHSPAQATVVVHVLTATPAPKTPAPTAAVQPSRTPTPQPAPTKQKSTSTPVTEMDPYDLEQSQVASFPPTCDDNSGYHSLSPSASWMARICRSREDERMEIVSQERKRYVLYYRDYVHPEDLHDGNLPMGRLYPHQWIDDDYLFFSSNIHVSGGGTCFFGFGKNGLYRLDLNSGVV